MDDDPHALATGDTLAKPIQAELVTMTDADAEADDAPPRGDDPTLAAVGSADGRAESTSARIPARIGRYIVIAPIGEGGMGLVFSAYDAELDRKVAVKLVRPALRNPTDDSSPDASHRRLLREAQVLAKLSHPNIIHVYEVGALNDEVFIAMEYFEGPTLERWQDRSDVSRRELLARYRAAGRGLAAAHAAGLVHRDFKPSNVLVGADGQVRVIDFGLARETANAASPSAANDGPVERLTMTGAIMGTPAYMAPEQHAGGPVDARTDQFSFCVALYEALYGERPFAGSTLAELTANVMAGRIQPPPRFERVPPWLRKPLLRGLAVNPDDRFPSISALLEQLDHDPAIRRRRVLLGVAVVIAVLLAVLAWDRVAEQRLAAQEGERLRLEFGRTRASDAEDQLLRLRTRSAAQRWDDLVLAWANEQLDHDPTRALASLRHLRELDDTLDAARTIAADAWQRGVARASTGLPGKVLALEASRSGAFVAVLTPGGSVHAWRADTGLLVPWTCPERARALAVASSSGVFAVGSDRGTIFIVDPSVGSVVSFVAHEGPIHALSFAPDDASLASAGEDRAVRRWQVATGERIDAMTNHDAAVVALTHELDPSEGPHAAALVSASATGQLAWWNPQTAKVQKIDAHGGPVRSLSAASGRVWSVAADGKVLSWRPGSRALPTKLEQVTSLRATAKGSVVAIHRDHSASLHDDDPDTPPRVLAVGSPVTHLAHSPDAGSIWLAGGDIGVQRWDAAPDHAEVLAIDGTVRALAFSPDGGTLAIADTHDTLYLMSLDRTHFASVAFNEPAVRMRFSNAGERVAAQLVDGSVTVFDAASLGSGLTILHGMRDHEIIGSFEGAPHPELAWTADDQAVVIGLCHRTDTCSVRKVDASDGQRLGVALDTDFVSTLVPDASGERVLIGRHRRSTVSVLEFAGGELYETQFADGELVLGQAWSEQGDGRVRIATADGETLRVWSWQPAAEQRHRILEESGFTELRPIEGATALYLRAGEKQAVLWSIAGTRFSPVPELPAGVSHIMMADDGRTLLARGHDPVAGQLGPQFGWLFDLEVGQGRRLPALRDPVALSVEGVVADYRWGAGVRVWDEPTPEGPEAFRTWLEQATTVVVPLEDLRDGPPAHGPSTGALTGAEDPP